jgi:hypothetical protein
MATACFLYLVGNAEILQYFLRIDAAETSRAGV